MTRESDVLVEAGVLERRSELEIEDFSSGCSVVEGLRLMEALVIDKGLTHEVVVARLR